MLEATLFHRVLLKDRLLKLLIGTPITLLCHFKEKENAVKVYLFKGSQILFIFLPKMYTFPDFTLSLLFCIVKISSLV